MKIINKRDSVIEPEDMRAGYCYSIKYDISQPSITVLCCYDSDDLIESYDSSNKKILLCDLNDGGMFIMMPEDIAECEVLNAELLIK